MQGAPSPHAATTVPNAGPSPTTATDAARSAHTAATNITTTRARSAAGPATTSPVSTSTRARKSISAYEFEYHADRPNTPALCNLDLNALLFDVCPDIEDADFFMGSVLRNRTAGQPQRPSDEHEPGRERVLGRAITRRIVYQFQSPERADRMEASRRTGYRGYLDSGGGVFPEKDGKETVIPERGYTEIETHQIFY